MTPEQLVLLEEGVAAYRYIACKLEFLEAALAWLCLPVIGKIHGMGSDVELAHACLYTGLWVATQPAADEEPAVAFMGRGSRMVN